MKNLFKFLCPQSRPFKLQFSPLEDITAYELVQILQISNSSKSFCKPVEQHCIDLFRQSKVERHWLLNGKRLSQERVEGGQSNGKR